MINLFNDKVINSVVILIDQFTKHTIENISYDDITKHASVITDIREISEEYFGSNLVIFEPSLGAIVTPELLRQFKETLSLSVNLVYQDNDLVLPYKQITKLVKADYSDISWNFIYAIVNNDLAILEPYQKSLKVLDSFKALRDKFPEDMQEFLDRFRGSYLELVRATDLVIQENSNLKETVKIQEVIGDKTIAGVKELRDLLDDAYNMIHTYQALLSESYSEVFGGFYPERPKVIYIKQVSHVSGMDTFLNVLFVVLTKQYKSSCKVIKLVDSSSALYMRYIPNNYVFIKDSYNTSEVLTNDFIVKLGAYKIMFDLLMLNRSGLDYLIIHDMRNDIGLALDKTLMDINVNEVTSDYAVLGEYNNVFSDGGKNIEFSWEFKDCLKYSGSKVTKLANHPTIISLLDLIV